MAARLAAGVANIPRVDSKGNVVTLTGSAGKTILLIVHCFHKLGRPNIKDVFILVLVCLKEVVLFHVSS